LSGDVSLNSRLYVGSDLTVKGRLSVFEYQGVSIINTTTSNYTFILGEDMSLNGNLTLLKDASFNNRLFVGGDVSINQRLIVNGDVSLNGNVYIGGNIVQKNDMTLYNTLFVAGDSTMNNRLFTMGDSSLNGNVYVGKDLIINGRLSVFEYLTQAVINTVTTTYTFTIDEDVSMNGNIYLNKDASFNGRLFVGGDASINQRLLVLGDTSLNGNVYIVGATVQQGDMSLNKRLIVGGDVSLNQRLNVRGDVSFNSRLFIGGDLVLNGRLSVYEYQTQSIINTTTSNYTFILAEDMSLNGNLALLKDASFNSRLFVGGDVSLNSRLYVNSDLSINQRLYVNGDVSFNGNLFISKSCYSNAFYSTSDYRIKDVIQRLDDTFTVDDIEPIEYINKNINKRDMGVIAHELQEIYPHLVTGEKDGAELQTVNYTGMIALLINEVKNIKKKLSASENITPLVRKENTHQYFINNPFPHSTFIINDATENFICDISGLVLSENKLINIKLINMAKYYCTAITGVSDTPIEVLINDQIKPIANILSQTITIINNNGIFCALSNIDVYE
jgi:predicted acyltransferase (DUF342 family)